MLFISFRNFFDHQPGSYDSPICVNFTHWPFNNEVRKGNSPGAEIYDSFSDGMISFSQKPIVFYSTPPGDWKIKFD